MLNNNIKGSLLDLTWIWCVELTQILVTSKADWQTGVNLLVTFTVDVEKWASLLRKKLEKINWQLINNPDLTAAKRKAFEDQVADIKKELLAIENQFTLLTVTKLTHTTHK